MSKIKVCIKSSGLGMEGILFFSKPKLKKNKTKLGVDTVIEISDSVLGMRTIMRSKGKRMKV